MFCFDVAIDERTVAVSFEALSRLMIFFLGCLIYVCFVI